MHNSRFVWRSAALLLFLGGICAHTATSSRASTAKISARHTADAGFIRVVNKGGSVQFFEKVFISRISEIDVAANGDFVIIDTRGEQAVVFDWHGEVQGVRDPLARQGAPYPNYRSGSPDTSGREYTTFVTNIN